MTHFKPPEKFDFSKESWPEWKSSFEMYRKISELEKKAQDMQIITLKYTMGSKCEEIIRTMNLSDEESKSYETVMKKFDEYFKPKRNELRLRREFQSRKQLPGEDMEVYLRELYKLAENCNFADKLDRIRDQFIYGLCDQDMIEKVEMLYMTSKEDTFGIDIVMEYCRSYRDTRHGKPGRSEQDTINRVEQRHFRQSNGTSGRATQQRDIRQSYGTSGRATQQRVEQSDFRQSCRACGGQHQRNRCPARGRKCFNCNGSNHFSSVCFRKQLVGQNEISENGEENNELASSSGEIDEMQNVFLA